MEILIGIIASLIITFITYRIVGMEDIKSCYRLWFTRDYWTDYNIVEALSWLAKAAIIIPGLLFGIEIWWLYWSALVTSILLIWASNKKLLPTLVGFNTLWIVISCIIISKNLL